MYAITSLLDPVHDQATQKLWEWLENQCGLMAIWMTPIPHFSWQVAEAYSLEEVEAGLGEMVKEIPSFEIKISGLGIFTGPAPVLYLSVVNNQNLLYLHQMFWQRFSPWGKNLNPLYTPESWVPHITLAYRDLDENKMACAIQNLAFCDLSTSIKIKMAAVMYENSGEIGVKSTFRFNETAPKKEHP